MSVRRMTVSLPEDTARRLKSAARGRSVSALLAELVDETLDQRELETQWRQLYNQVAPSLAASQKAERILSALIAPTKSPRQAKRRAA
jgi:hypothetical protein